jgi:hypothetical protein
MGIFSSMMGRPPKAPKDRRTDSMKIPLTSAEKRSIEQAAQTDDAKPVTWARDVLMRAVARRGK